MRLLDRNSVRVERSPKWRFKALFKYQLIALELICQGLHYYWVLYYKSGLFMYTCISEQI